MARRIKKPLPFAALTVLLLAGLNIFGLWTPLGLVISSVAVSLLVFAVVPWKLLIPKLPRAVGAVLIILALMPLAGIVGAVTVAQRMSPISLKPLARTPASDADMAWDEGNVQLKTEEWHAAIASFSRIPTHDRRYWNAQSRIALANWQLGRYAQAEEIYSRLEKSAPEKVKELRARWNRARVLLSRGTEDDYDAATRIFDELVEHPLFMEDPDTVYNASVLAFRSKHPARAAKLLERFPFSNDVVARTTEGDTHGKALVLDGLLSLESDGNCDAVRERVTSGLKLVRVPNDVEDMFRALLPHCKRLHECGIAREDCRLESDLGG